LLQFFALPDISGNLVSSLLERTRSARRPDIRSSRLPIPFGAALRHSTPLALQQLRVHASASTSSSGLVKRHRLEQPVRAHPSAPSDRRQRSPRQPQHAVSSYHQSVLHNAHRGGDFSNGLMVVLLHAVGIPWCYTIMYQVVNRRALTASEIPRYYGLGSRWRNSKVRSIPSLSAILAIVESVRFCPLSKFDTPG
jgi:hypothetical protein